MHLLIRSEEHIRTPWLRGEFRPPCWKRGHRSLAWKQAVALSVLKCVIFECYIGHNDEIVTLFFKYFHNRLHPCIICQWPIFTMYLGAKFQIPGSNSHRCHTWKLRRFFVLPCWCFAFKKNTLTKVAHFWVTYYAYNHTSFYYSILSGTSVAPTSQFSSSAILLLFIADN
jgi:hypothetical protein